MFQRAAKARKCVAGAFLHKGLDRPLYENVNVKPGWNQRPKQTLEMLEPDTSAKVSCTQRVVPVK